MFYILAVVTYIYLGMGCLKLELSKELLDKMALHLQMQWLTFATIAHDFTYLFQMNPNKP